MSTQIPFSIPLDGSVQFAYSNAIITKAVLQANDMVLSVIKFTDDDPQYKEPVGVTDIPFLGDAYFHGVLAADWDVKVILYTNDHRTPNLTLKYEKEPLTWKNCAVPYRERVTVGSVEGKKEFYLVYYPTGGGFSPVEDAERVVKVTQNE